MQFKQAQKSQRHAVALQSGDSATRQTNRTGQANVYKTTVQTRRIEQQIAANPAYKYYANPTTAIPYSAIPVRPGASGSQVAAKSTR